LSLSRENPVSQAFAFANFTTCAAYALEAAVAGWDPKAEGAAAAAADPFKTLFVGRLSYDVDEAKLRREFEQWGPIKSVRIVVDSDTSQPRGYAFVEYNRENDMKLAFKQADGRRIENRRVVVDAERGRTVTNWRPRRLGGGLGQTRVVGLYKLNTVYTHSLKSAWFQPPLNL
jgi:U1 small nuclear ribonucleoprotein